MKGLRRIISISFHKIFPAEYWFYVMSQRKTLLTLGNFENLLTARRLRFFLENWKEPTKGPFILKLFLGYQIPLLSDPTQFSSFSEIQMKKEEKIIVDQKIEKMLEKQAIKLLKPSKDQFLSTLFLVTKKDTGHRPVINFKKLNRYIHTNTSNGRSISSERNSPEDRLYVQDRFKRRLFCSTLSFKLPKIYQIRMEREYLSVCQSLCFGLSTD